MLDGNIVGDDLIGPTVRLSIAHRQGFKRVLVFDPSGSVTVVAATSPAWTISVAGSSAGVSFGCGKSPLGRAALHLVGCVRILARGGWFSVGTSVVREASYTMKVECIGAV